MDVLYHGIKTQLSYDLPLCFPHELLMIWEIEIINRAYTKFYYQTPFIEDLTISCILWWC